MARRAKLDDEIDRTLLDQAQHALRVHFALMLTQDVKISRLVESLTDPEIRHHVQTLVDLTPTR